MSSQVHFQPFVLLVGVYESWSMDVWIQDDMSNNWILHGEMRLCSLFSTLLARGYCCMSSRWVYFLLLLWCWGLRDFVCWIEVRRAKVAEGDGKEKRKAKVRRWHKRTNFFLWLIGKGYVQGVWVIAMMHLGTKRVHYRPFRVHSNKSFSFRAQGMQY